MPTRVELEAAIVEHLATVRRLRDQGEEIAAWVVEQRMNALIDERARLCPAH